MPIGVGIRSCHIRQMMRSQAWPENAESVGVVVAKGKVDL